MGSETNSPNVKLFSEFRNLWDNNQINEDEFVPGIRDKRIAAAVLSEKTKIIEFSMEKLKVTFIPI